MKIAALGFVYLALAVVLGAFVAHSLKGRLDESSTGVFHTGQEYQVTVALALILAGVCSAQRPALALRWPVALLTMGSVVFSGSLYALSLSGVRIWGAVTPIGGVLVLAALVWTAFVLWRGGDPDQA